MIQEIEVTTRKQVPTEGYDWLYQDDIVELDEEQVINRTFQKVVYLGAHSTEWSECTQAEYEEWKTAHPDPSPVETLNQKVTRLIRVNYDQSQENHMNRVGGKIVMGLATDAEKEEWLVFNAYVEECIEKAKKELEPDATE